MTTMKDWPEGAARLSWQLDMKMNNDQQTSAEQSHRLHFPEDEKRLPWLPALLDSLAILDGGVAQEIARIQKDEGRSPACGNGCSVCCGQADIPLFPHELIALYWFAAEKIEPALRSRLKEQLQSHAEGLPCPFLIDGSCAVHPVRPLSCRQFTVFSKPCAPDEDPYYTRREDVLVPPDEARGRSFAAIIPLYDKKAGATVDAVIESIQEQMMNLQEFDWKRLAAVLDKLENRPV